AGVRSTSSMEKGRLSTGAAKRLPLMTRGLVSTAARASVPTPTRQYAHQTNLAKMLPPALPDDSLSRLAAAGHQAASDDTRAFSGAKKTGPEPGFSWITTYSAAASTEPLTGRSTSSTYAMGALSPAR